MPPTHAPHPDRRKAAVSVVAGLGTECSDLEGRVLTADFGTHYIVNVYTPNSGAPLSLHSPTPLSDPPS